MGLFNWEKRIDAVPPFQGVQPLNTEAILQAFYPGDPRLGFTQQINVTEQSSFGVAAVSRSCQLIAGTLAGAEKDVVSINTGKSIRSGVANLVHNPHPLIDEFQWWEYCILSLLFRGDFMAYMQRDGGGIGPVTSLTPVDASTVQVLPVYSKSNQNILTDILYVVNVNGELVGLDKSEMFHIAGMGFDGLRGMSVVKYGARSLGGAIGADQAARDFYANGSMLSGFLSTDKRIDEKSAEALKQRWRKNAAGINNAGGITVLDFGLKFEPMSMSMQDAQFLQTRQFNVQEVSRLFGVPPHLLGDVSEKPQTVEEVSLALVQYCLELWMGRTASAFTKWILPNAQKMVWRTDDLIRPDMRTRSAAAVMWRQAQIKSINELRAEEHLPPLLDPRADDPFFANEAPPTGAAATGTNVGKPEHPTPSDKPNPEESPANGN